MILATYEIEFYALSGAVIGALIVGKVVVVLDKTLAGNRFDAGHSIGMAALYKTAVYSAITFLVLLGEKLFHAYRGKVACSVKPLWRYGLNAIEMSSSRKSYASVWPLWAIIFIKVLIDGWEKGH